MFKSFWKTLYMLGCSAVVSCACMLMLLFSVARKIAFRYVTQQAPNKWHVKMKVGVKHISWFSPRHPPADKTNPSYRGHSCSRQSKTVLEPHRAAECGDNSPYSVPFTQWIPWRRQNSAANQTVCIQILHLLRRSNDTVKHARTTLAPSGG